MYVYNESTNTTSTATLKFLLSPFHLPPPVISTKHFAHTLAALFPSPAAPYLLPPSPTASASSLPPLSYSKCNIRTRTPQSTSEPDGAKIMG